MEPNILQAGIFALARNYLIDSGTCIASRDVIDAIVTTTSIRVSGWPDDVVGYRIDIRHPEWSAVIHLGLRDGRPWRMRVIDMRDTCGTHGGPAGAHDAMIAWLRSI